MKFIDRYYIGVLWSIPIISLSLHFHILDHDLVGIHVWRQTETQTVINNFYRESMNILNPKVNFAADTDRILRKEFPLMQWIFALFYKLSGDHIIVTRLLSFLTGMGSVYGMYRLCNNLSGNKSMAAICAWCFNFSPVFYYYTLNPMPDNMALCFGIWSLASFYSYTGSGKISHALLSALFLSLATLIKLPFALYGVLIATYLLVLLTGKKITIGKASLLSAVYIICMIPPIIWYGTVVPQWNSGLTKGVFDAVQDKKELLYIFFGTLASTLPELLINYGAVLFFIAGSFLVFKHRLYDKRKFMPFIVLGVALSLYFLFEINMITTVHDYYLFPFLPFIFLVTAYGANRLLSARNKRLNMLCLICLAVLPATAFLRADSRWDEKDPGFNHVYYDDKEQIRSLIPRDAYCVVGNDVSRYILLYYIDKKGWTYNDDELTGERLGYYITKGAKYLFLDGHIDDKAEIRDHLAEKILDKGTLRVYKLKQ